ncbi:MAG TPA: hypothetical protein VF891_06790 [Gaiellaceae bacterium]
MHVVVAGAFLEASRATAEQPVSWPSEAAKLFDVDMDELARSRALVAVGGSNGSRRERFPSPIRRKTAETVESGIRKISAISAAVIRSRRSNSITRTRSGGVRRATRRGAEERSTRPALPSLR